MIKKILSLRKYILSILLLIVLIWGILGILAIWHAHTPKHSEEEVRMFIDKIITSVIEDTDFYKVHSTEIGLYNIKNNKSLFSYKYETIVLDYTFGSYEGIIVKFDNGNDFYIDIREVYDGPESFEVMVWSSVKNHSEGEK